LKRPTVSLLSSARSWWCRERQRTGALSSLRELGGIAWEFLRESMPERRKRRYGDADFDWECRVDTTSATVSWRTRLLGLLHSPYQPVDPQLFHEIIKVLKIDFSGFTFVDIGSGKGRALLLASEYPFRRLVGIELLPELHQVAQQNIARASSSGGSLSSLELVCGDAGEFIFPQEPLVVFLFHPLPEAGLGQLLSNVEKSLLACPRPFYLIYANPIFESLVRECLLLKKITETHQYAVFSNANETAGGKARGSEL
jgi:SAM-dependent methyltransferase